MQITRGKIQRAKKVCIYGPEGIGKSTLASKFPEPVFIDTEGSTGSMDVARLPAPSSWQMLLEEISYIKQNPKACKTLVIDTIDWAEMMCVQHVCDKHHKTGIEDFGYGNGYVYAKEEFGRFLNRLTDLIGLGINVVLTAHAQLRKFEQPDEMGAYDRWELKLGKKTASQTAPLVKEWSDMLLFCNYKTHSVAVDDKGKKRKAQGGRRVMYTAHHPCWDAKNRDGLPEECEMSYVSIRGVIEHDGQDLPKSEPPQEKEAKSPSEDFMRIPEGVPEQVELSEYEKALKAEADRDGKKAEVPKTSIFHIDERIPKALRDLMEDKLVTEDEIQQVVSDIGYYPRVTPIWDYDDDLIYGGLIGEWDKVYARIKKIRDGYEIPFDKK